MSSPIRILLQTTIPGTADDWNIGRFSMLRDYLAGLTDEDGAPLCDVTARNRTAPGSPDPILSTAANIMRNDIGSRGLQRVHQRRNVGSLVHLGEATRRLRRSAHATKIRHDDGMISDQACRQRRPHISTFAKAVNKDNRRSTTANAHMDRHAIRFDFPGTKFGRIGQLLCLSGLG